PVEPGLVTDQITVRELVPDQRSLVARRTRGQDRPGDERREERGGSKSPQASTHDPLLRDELADLSGAPQESRPMIASLELASQIERDPGSRGYDPEGKRTNSKCMPSGTSHCPPQVNPHCSKILTNRASWCGRLPKTLRPALMSMATPHAWWEMP